MKLKGKRALITGASRGIGRGIAEVFAEEGADVAVNYIASASAAAEVASWICGKGRRAIAVGADVANRADVETMVPFLDLTDEQWTRLTDVNLRGEWLCAQVFCKRAVAAGRKGSIVNIGSV